MTPAAEDVHFIGGSEARLAGVLHQPDGEPRGGLLLAHCFTCGKDLHTMTRLARGLTRAGFVVLRFDFTGLGGSGGDFSSATVATNVADLVAAAGVLGDRHGPRGMIGHSVGGTAVLLAAGGLPDVRSVATLGAPSAVAHIGRLVAREADGYVATVAGRRFPLADAFVDDLDRHPVLERVADLRRPLAVLHAVADEEVSVTEGEQLFVAARQPKAFVPLLGGADHLLRDRRCAEDAVGVLADWFTRTL